GHQHASAKRYGAKEEAKEETRSQLQNTPMTESSPRPGARCTSTLRRALTVNESSGTYRTRPQKETTVAPTAVANARTPVTADTVALVFTRRDTESSQLGAHKSSALFFSDSASTPKPIAKLADSKLTAPSTRAGVRIG